MINKYCCTLLNCLLTVKVIEKKKSLAKITSRYSLENLYIVYHAYRYIKWTQNGGRLKLYHWKLALEIFLKKYFRTDWMTYIQVHAFSFWVRPSVQSIHDPQVSYTFWVPFKYLNVQISELYPDANFFPYKFLLSP